jgi:hypothetical protein
MEKIGTVILGDTGCYGWILEEGCNRQIYNFNPQTVNGNIDLDPQARQYPARLKGKIVKFTVSIQGVVTDLHTLKFDQPIHNECRGAVTMAGKNCTCGNSTNKGYKHCVVCAIRNNRCVICENPLF